MAELLCHVFLFPLGQEDDESGQPQTGHPPGLEGAVE